MAKTPHAPTPRQRRKAATVAAVFAALITSVVASGATPATAGPRETGRPAPPTAKPTEVTRQRSDVGKAASAAADAAFAATMRLGEKALAEQRQTNKTNQTAMAGSGTLGVTAEGATASATVANGQAGNGDYAATPLSSSATWTAGGSSGSFAWEYPMQLPPVAAGPVPALTLQYDSGRVDGRVSAANNQPSVVGEGFELTSSYIERAYGSCAEDGHDSSHDRCWRDERLRLVLNGRGYELVQESVDVFRLKSDDGTVLERLTGTENGDNNGEHWRLTTSDGTRYYFGMNQLPGHAAGAPVTHSTWTVPVYTDDAGDADAGQECRKDTFADSWCQQGWRWNVDYVVDLHKNASTYWYAAEHNDYARNGQETNPTDYIRGGYLTRIDYGLRADNLFDPDPNDSTSALLHPAPQQVTLDYAERCLQPGTGCDELTQDTKANWPDVPFDSICKDGTDCTDDLAPTFFTRKRLTGVSTHIQSGAGYRDVDTWALEHVFVDPGDVGDTTDQVLWLSSIQRTGQAGADPITTAPVKLAATLDQSMRNRVDVTGDGIAPLIKPRISQIESETGAVTTVTYSVPDCTGTDTPQPDQNTRRCFPVWWAPEGGDKQLDWFHKYVVTNVNVQDTTTGETVNTSYVYGDGDAVSDDAAWHYTDDPMTPDAHRTWSQWRGYSKVTTLVGDANAPMRSATVSIYLRGMDGDRINDTTNKDVTVTGIDAPAIVDADQYAGFTREVVTYNGQQRDGALGAEVSGSIHTPWSKTTATHSYPNGQIDDKTSSAVTVKATMVRTKTTTNRTRVTSGTAPYNRSVTSTNTFDDHGFVEYVDSYATPNENDPATKTDQTCTRTWYARNTDQNILNLVAREQTVASACAGIDTVTLPSNSQTSGEVTSDVVTLYDDATGWANQTPTRGLPASRRRVTGYDTATRQPIGWQTTASYTYDALGRVRTDTDPGSNTTETSYEPTGAGVPVSITVTNAEGHTTTTTYDPARMVDTKVVDANGKRTEKTYDALGRLTAVWTPISNRLLGAPATYKFQYHLGGKDADGYVDESWVATSTPKGNGSEYTTSYELFDALLRPVQTQRPSPRGGRLLTDTWYDHRGLAYREFADIWDDQGAPNGTRQVAPSGSPVETETLYDGAGRPTTVHQYFYDGATPRWTTTTSYTGDSVAVAPPAGGTATREFTDALGRVTERRQYKGNSPTLATYAATKFTYDAHGRSDTIKGPDNAVWSYDYDLHGRPVSTTDPDHGTTTTSYNALDQVIKTVDAQGRVLQYTYDKIGRKTGAYTSSISPTTQQASWTYDTVAKGYLTSSTRFIGGTTGSAYTRKVTAYDNLYRPTGTQVVLPANDPLVVEPLSGSPARIPQTLSFATAFNRDGTVQSTTEPQVAGLPSEVFSTQYNDSGLPVSSTGTSSLVLDTSYSPLGQVWQTTLGVSAANNNRVWLTNTYEDGTARLVRHDVTATGLTYHPLDLTYSYDPVGNVTSILDTAASTYGPDYQCFTYDGYRQLTHAWTPKTADCSTANRSNTNLGGKAPYWTEYSYTNGGMRATQIVHATTSTGTNTKTTYNYGGTCGSTPITLGPHLLRNTTTGTSTTPAASYCYDKTGNATSRPGVTSGTTQALTWDAEGRLSRLKEGTAKDTTYIYDADGNLLIRRPSTETAAGTTVLYLGATEVQVTQTGTGSTAAWTAKGLRYYSHGGQQVAVRTATAGTSGTKLTFLAGDHHGTQSAAVDATTLGVTKRFSAPFGGSRSSQTWVDDKAFLGKPLDAGTGLTHIGAREYDATLGRFISVDPLLDTADGLSLNGYAYSNNNPVTFSDPTGLKAEAGYTDNNELNRKNAEASIQHTLHRQGLPAWEKPRAPQQPDRGAGGVVGYVAGVAQSAAESADLSAGGLALAKATGATPSQHVSLAIERLEIDPQSAGYFGGYWLGIGVAGPGGVAGKAGSSAARLATRGAANGGRRSVAIGEDMTNRVEPFAKRIGADTYKADPTAPREMWMKNNRDWIRKQMDDGCTIYDCGPAPGRSNFPNPTSPYYQMELDEIGLRNYPFYFRVPLE